MNIKSTLFPTYKKNITKVESNNINVSNYEKANSSFDNEVKNANSDKVMISSNATNQSIISRFGKPISNEINNTDNSEKISRLKEEIANGTYHVSTDELVDKLLSRWSADV